MRSFGFNIRTTRILTGTFICVLGVGAVVWGTLLLPILWSEASPRSIASKLLQGDTFKLQSLFDEANQAEQVAHHSYCDPAALHSLFILRLFIFQISNEPGNRELAGSTYLPLYKATVKSLSCAPADPFAWLALFWLDAGRHGIDDRNTNYLRLSYSLGANEGWISLWRVRLAFLFFERLPTDLANDAVSEFVRLVNSERYRWQIAGIFKDASPLVQSRIIGRLEAATLTSRVAFAKALHDRDMDIEIPGVEKPDVRPWR
jgi:hypothetical protein